MEIKDLENILNKEIEKNTSLKELLWHRKKERRTKLSIKRDFR